MRDSYYNTMITCFIAPQFDHVAQLSISSQPRTPQYLSVTATRNIELFRANTMVVMPSLFTMTEH